MNSNKKLYSYATVMIVAFILAMIAGVCIMLRNITDIQPTDTSSSNIDIVETVSTELSTTVETTSITTSSTVTSSLTSTVTSTSYNETEIETSSVSTVITTTEDIIISIINPQIIVIPDETTVKSTKATDLTTTITSTVCTDTTALVSTNNRKKLGVFQGTYYVYGKGTYGGSGRELIDCSIGNGIVKGSVSSRSLFNMLGYYVDGRTTVYIESESCPDLCGYYYLDDSTHESVLGVIDFFYNYEENSPFCGIGRLYDINVYV